MSRKGASEFLQKYQELFSAPSEELASELYHLPCVFMDRSTFIPINKQSEAVSFHNEINHDITDRSPISATFNIISIKDLSDSLARVSVNWKLSYDEDKCTLHMIVNYLLIKSKDTWKTTVLEIENREIPHCEHLSHKSKEAEHLRLTNKIKCANE